MPTSTKRRRATWPNSSIHSPHERALKGRRLDHLNCDVERTIELMRKHGASLHRTNRAHSVRWELSIGAVIPDEVTRTVITRRHVIGVGDALFGPQFSQTWRYVEEDHNA